jgi:hypothetical protein
VAVAVFGQLDHLLRERNLTIEDLRRQIEERHGLVVDLNALQRLANPEGVHEVDLRMAASVVMLLDIGLDDLFSYGAGSADIDPSLEEEVLDEEPVRRIRALLDLQNERGLSDQEQHELDVLVESRVAITHDLLDQFREDPQRRREFIEREKRRRASVSP